MTDKLTFDDVQMFSDLVATIESQLSIITEKQAKFSTIYIVGCGDSYFAGLASQYFYQQYELPVQVIESMEFSRYCRVPNPTESILIAVSNGGKVSRTLEAIRYAKSLGMTTIAATGYPDKPIAQEADIAIIAALPDIRAILASLDKALVKDKPDVNFEDASQPGGARKIASQLGISHLNLLMIGLSAYYGSLILLYLIAIRFAELRQATETFTLDRQTILNATTDSLIKTVNSNLENITMLASKLKDSPAFIYTGAGPSLATAHFSATKLLEQPQTMAVGVQLEEWAHTHYFLTRPSHIPVFLIAPPGPSHSRAIEQANAIRATGGTSIAVCEANDTELIEICDYAMPIYTVNKTLSENFSPLLYSVPGQMFAFALLQEKGQTPLKEPYDFKTIMSINFQTIYESKIISRDPLSAG